MISREQLALLLPIACHWAEQQEERICANGIELEADLQIDAYQIGVRDIKRVRLLKVDRVPQPTIPELRYAVEQTGMLSAGTMGITFRYGIYIRSDCWNQRRLIVHELVHTMQYERMGGFFPFLEQYLEECITVGYPHGFLEQEARRIEHDMCR